MDSSQNIKEIIKLENKSDQGIESSSPSLGDDNVIINSGSIKQAYSLPHSQEATVVHKDVGRIKSKPKMAVLIKTDGKLELMPPKKVVGESSSSDNSSDEEEKPAPKADPITATKKKESSSWDDRNEDVKKSAVKKEVKEEDGSALAENFPPKSTKSQLRIYAALATKPHSPKPVRLDGLSLISTYLNTSSETDSPVVKSSPAVLFQGSPITHLDRPVSSSSPRDKNATSFQPRTSSLDGVRPLNDSIIKDNSWPKRNPYKFTEMWQVKTPKINSVHPKMNLELENQSEIFVGPAAASTVSPKHNKESKTLKSKKDLFDQQVDIDELGLDSNEDEEITLDSIDSLGLDVSDSPRKMKTCDPILDNSADNFNKLDVFQSNVDQEGIYADCCDSENDYKQSGTTQDLPIWSNNSVVKLDMSISRPHENLVDFCISPTHEMDYGYLARDSYGSGENSEPDANYQNQTCSYLEPEKEKPILFEKEISDASIDELLGTDDEDDVSAPSCGRLSQKLEQCTSRFSMPEMLQSIQNAHQDTRYCNPLSEKINVPKLAIKSKQVKINKEKVSCPDCKTLYTDVRKLEDHIKILHSQPCPSCERAFILESRLKEHMQFAHNILPKGSFVCKLCQHPFNKKGHYNDHIRIKHNFKCQSCVLRFNSRRQMEDHCTDAHPDEAMKSPNVGFKDRDETPSSDSNLLECEYCATSFSCEEFLSHINLTHSFPCTHQADSESNNSPHLQFVSSDELAWHVHRDHGGPTPDIQVKPPGSYGSTSHVSRRNGDSNFSEQPSFQETCSSVETDEVFQRKRNESKECSSSNASRSSPEPKCTLCDKTYADTRKLMAHMKRRHPTGKLEQKPLFWCEWCQEEFVNEHVFIEHKEKEHKYECQRSGCKRKYIFKLDLDHHVQISHDRKSTSTDNFTRDRLFGFVCSLCEIEFMERKWYQGHSKIPHPFSCSHDDCQKKYTNQRNLSTHLREAHGIAHLNVCEGVSGEEVEMTLTAKRSNANIEMVESAEEWIRSDVALDQMVKVMRGELKSKRHELFMDRKERQQCGGLKTSKLYLLSNPGFMGEGEKDSSVIQYLVDDVFKLHFHESDPRLQEVGIDSAFVYASTVLFPETFLNQHRVSYGLSREQAEKAYMEIKVTNEEREGFEQEIREAAATRETQMDSDDDDNWGDASILVEDESDNSAIIVEDEDL